MESNLDWDQALESIDDQNLPALSLLREVSDVFAPEADVDVDLDRELLCLIQHEDETPASPAAISYASSDESSSEALSVQNSCSSSDFDGEEKKKRRATRKRVTAGLSVQEKRELRKLRNRELAAESRKRKNDEMDRLRKENTDLRKRVSELEKQLAVFTSQGTGGGGVVVGGKRSRMGTAVGTSIAAASLALFVITGPAEAHGIGNSASVLLTALDSCDGQMFKFAKFVSSAFLAVALFCIMALFTSKSASSPLRLSSVASTFLPRRVNSLSVV